MNSVRLWLRLLAAVLLFGFGRSIQAQNNPLITSVYPDGSIQFQAASNLTFTVLSPVGTTIPVDNISVSLTGLSLPGLQSSQTLTAANGLIISVSTNNLTVSAPLAPNIVYQGVIQVTDANGYSATKSFTFDTITPGYTFEAEDFDYNGGNFIDNPQTDAYFNLNSIDLIDVHNLGGGWALYRPNPAGLGTQPNSDIPRAAYLNSTNVDYNTGWSVRGNWANYTRTYPDGTYYIYMRGALQGNAANDVASVALVTAGLGTTNQTLAPLGSFSLNSTGDYQTYTWSSLLDAKGNPAQFTGGGVKTLRVITDGGNYNVNCFLLMAADTTAPAITDVYPNGTNFFQSTNQLSFNVLSDVGVQTNSISVTGGGITGLSFSGTANAWHVTCPLVSNTNYTLTITVTSKNGSTTQTNISFNDFSATDYQWEAEDYDAGGNFYDNAPADAYFGLPSVPEIDNHQAGLDSGPFNYRLNSPAPSTKLAGDQARPQFSGHSDFQIGAFGLGSWLNYTRHYPDGTYYVWGRFHSAGNPTAVLNQLSSGQGTTTQTSNTLGNFLPTSTNSTDWQWSVLSDTNGHPLKIRFDDSAITLQLAGSSVTNQDEISANFFMLAPVAPDLFTALHAENLSSNTVQIIYSKPVDLATATDIDNYTFTNGLDITAASLASDNVTLTLTTGPLVSGSNYTLVINSVRDKMNLPNIIAGDTAISFQAIPYTLAPIGNPAVYPTVIENDTGFDITTSGGPSGFSEQGALAYQRTSGNFDVAVRLASLSLSDIVAKAGVMARETLATNGRFAATLATPAMNGVDFEWRNRNGDLVRSLGNFSINYPNTWLRLQRTNNVFNSYAGYDGQNWTLLGSTTIAMSNIVYLGLFENSNNTNAATAQFRDFAPVTNAVLATQINPRDAIGPSSRNTPIAISEIMYKPAARPDGKNLEFIELYNSNPWFQDISGYQLTCADMSYTFPSNTIIPGGGYFVIAAAPADVTSVYGITNVFGPYTGSLKKAETLELLNEVGSILLTVPYSSTYPWPVAALGTGHSIVLANPTYGEGDPRAWAISSIIGGSPGQMDAFRPNPLANVVINEILPHSENVSVPQFIELYNHSPNSVDVSGCILTDDPTTNKFIIPSSTVIPPAGFVSFTAPQFGFTLNGAGETLYFIQPDSSAVIDAVQFGAQSDGVSYGRWPDGANDFYALQTPTPDDGNSSIVIGDIVINELMYDPISGNDDDQYIELYNQGASNIDLSGWQFTTGVTFTFPANTMLTPNGYLVLGRNLPNLFAKYTNLNSGNTLGNYSGKLSHSGELLTLVQPQKLGTNVIYVVEDQVTYSSGGRWGEWAAGGGSSLELINPRSNHRLAANWADSDETSKSAWTNIETTGVLDNGANYDASIDYAQLGLLDTGECLVDDIEVDYQGSNYISNFDFENGTNSWAMQGCMSRSSLENSGYNSSYSLHVRSSDHVWPGVNSCQVPLNNTNLQAGMIATLRFKARWLHGWPEALLRLNGNWLEAAGALPVPGNLGSPGMPNSRAANDSGPAIYNVTHFPLLPAGGQPVVVSAQIHDFVPVTGLTLYYRLDPATNYTAVPLTDDGTAGDTIAGDGVFSGTIPGQTANQIVAYYIVASDNLSVTSRFPALLTDNSPTRECVIMFGDTSRGGSFGDYHLWLTQASANRWNDLTALSNEGNDCTFVNGNRVMYNIQGRYAGSPFHQNFNGPYGNLCHYKWVFNDDDKFLGATSFNKIHQPGNSPGDDDSFQREQLANTFLRALGVPWLNRRFVAVFVNGNRRGSLMEDTQCPDSELIKEHFPNDTGGYLFKMQSWPEFAPFPVAGQIAFTAVTGATLSPYTTTDNVKKVARYRYNYLVRRTPDSASDYTNVFSLVDAANSAGTSNYVANLENIADMNNWMRVFAANHAAGNWDSFGALSGQNLYSYIGTQGTKFSLLMFDFNLVFSNSAPWNPGQNLFTVNPADTNLATIFSTPAFTRMYWRALQELVNGPLSVAKSGPLLEAKYNTFLDNGFSPADPANELDPWLVAAQVNIASQLAAIDATGYSLNPVTVSNNTAYLSGTAPVLADTISIDGAEWPITWTSLTNWIAAIPLHSGANAFTTVALDKNGQPIAGSANATSVNYTSPPVSPVGQIVINEIDYNLLYPEAEFLELYNNSTNTAFDLSGWSLQGLGYVFPAGSEIAPNSYLVLAADRTTFAGVYGATNPVFDVFSGVLTPGVLLSLIEPGTNGGSNTIVTEVQCDIVPPWPAYGGDTGSSLQLVDPTQDNWRVGNWAVSAYPGLTASPSRTNTVAQALAAFPTLFINEVEPDNLNGVTNSAGQHVPWLEIYNSGTNSVSLGGFYLSSDYSNLKQWPFPMAAVIGPGEFKTIFADGLTNLAKPGELHASFVLPAGSGSLALTQMGVSSQLLVLDFINYTNVPANESYGSFPDGQSFTRQLFYNPTAGGANNGSAMPPASFITYTGSTYTQDFNDLPDPGATSVNSDNPVTINGVTYALANPFDFAYPVMAKNGGLGLASLAGWYGAANPNASVGTRFGGTDGDQTTGGQISFGSPNSSDRALGLLATSTTGYTLFGAKFLNATGQTLKYMNLSFNGEVWRQSDTPKTLTFYYWIDPSGTNSLTTAATAALPALNVSFPTVSGDKGGVNVIGTNSPNIKTLAVTNQVITNWPPNTALWLVWEMSDDTGKAQGLAIDNLSFAAYSQPYGPPFSLPSPVVTPTNLVFTFPTVVGPTYQVQACTNLATGPWFPVGDVITGTGNAANVTNAIQTNSNLYFRLELIP